MTKDHEKPEKRSFLEKLLAPFAFLTGNPTKPHAVPFMTSAPRGLALIHTAPSAAEADMIRQVLGNEGFHIEYVPPVTTGIFGTSGSAHIYVDASQEDEAREFLKAFLGSGNDEPSGDDTSQS